MTPQRIVTQRIYILVCSRRDLLSVLSVACIVGLYLVGNSTMWFGSELLPKLISQIGLFAIFLWLFGIPAIERYQKQEVIVISSIEHTGGILAPTISVVVRKSPFMTGWKSDNVTSSVELIDDQCGRARDIQEWHSRGNLQFLPGDQGRSSWLHRVRIPDGSLTLVRGFHLHILWKIFHTEHWKKAQS